MPTDSAAWPTKLVKDLAQRYSSLDEAGVEKFASSVPRGLFLAVDRLASYYLMTEATPPEDADKPTAPPIRTTSVRKAPAIGTKRIAKKAAKAAKKPGRR